MQHIRIAAFPARLLGLCRLLPVLAGVAMLITGGFANAASLFENTAEIVKAVDAIKDKIGGGPVRVLKIQISPDIVTIQAQDPKNPRHVDEWRAGRIKRGWFQWEMVGGPDPVDLNLINRDLEANLFDLDEVRLDAAATLIGEAIRRAALEDPAGVGSMEIERQVYILPEPSSGPVRWRVNVRSGRESAQIIADLRGTIVGQDLTGTNRMRNFDLLRQPEMAADAARDFRAALGTEPILLRASVGHSGVGFDTNLPADQAAAKSRSIIHQDQAFSWNLNGLHRTLGGSTHVQVPGAGSSDVPFGIDDADWTQLPRLAVAAREKLGMPQGTIGTIELRKSAEGVGAPVLLWRIEIADANGEKGSVFADAAGSVKRVMLPESRRKPADWLDPATVADAFARIGREFGAEAKLVEITFDDNKVRISAEDPRQPGKLIDVILSDQGFRRFGDGFAMAAAMHGKPRTFAIAELAPLTAPRIADLEAKTLARMNLAKIQITRVTIGHNMFDPSPKGNVTIEIRAEVPPFNAPMPPGGRVVYELDGTVIKYYLP